MVDGTGSVSEEIPRVFIVDHSGWEILSALFSEGATVIELHLVLENISVTMDTPLSAFSWPRPPESCWVRVHEPDSEKLVERIQTLDSGAVLDLKDGNSPLGLELMKDDPDPFAIGKIFIGPCTSCGSDELVVESLRLQTKLLERYSESHSELSFTFDPKRKACYLGDCRAIVLRCCTCYDTFASSALIKDGMFRMVSDES